MGVAAGVVFERGSLSVSHSSTKQEVICVFFCLLVSGKDDICKYYCHIALICDSEYERPVR
uniref:Uncharacterized protein n=1 Tax=Anguilla anguilla TaxID=7936 RepID=A0A0E9WE26_ANGAN